MTDSTENDYARKGKLKNISGLWVAHTKSGDEYYQAKLFRDSYIKLFKVKQKATDKHPDYNLVFDWAGNDGKFINIAGMYVKETKSGDIMLRGRFGNLELVVLPVNMEENSENAPSYNLLFSPIEEKPAQVKGVLTAAPIKDSEDTPLL